TRGDGRMRPGHCGGHRAIGVIGIRADAPMLIKDRVGIPPSEITPKDLYLHRRGFLTSAGAAIMAFATNALTGLAVNASGAKLDVIKKMSTTSDPPTPYNTVTTYNNFYEFGSEKDDPARNAKPFRPKPWSVAIEGHCLKPGVYT